MTQHVLLQIRRLHGGVSALFATERFFSGMNQLVSLEISRFCGGVIALCTSKRLLTTMSQHMAFQYTRPITCVVALVAAVRLLSFIQRLLLGIFCIIVCLHFSVFLLSQAVLCKVDGLLITKLKRQTKKS